MRDIKRLFLYVILSIFIFSCSPEPSSLIHNQSSLNSFDIEIVKKKLEESQSIDSGFDRVLFEDFVISLSFNGNLDYHLIPFDYASRESDSTFNFNQYLAVDNNYNIRDVRVFDKFNPDRHFSFRDVTDAITSYLYDIVIGRSDELVIMEFDLAGEVLDGYISGKKVSTDDPFWLPTNDVVSLAILGSRFEYDCGPAGGTAWFWIPYENAPESDWHLLYVDCFGGGDGSIGSPTNSNEVELAAIADIRVATCYSVAIIRQYDYLGIEFPWLDTYTPNVQGHLSSKKTIIERTDGSIEEDCTYSAFTSVGGGDSGPMSFNNLSAGVVTPTTSVHGWSTYVNCSWIQIAGNSIACSDNSNHTEYVSHPNIESIEVPSEDCICN